MISNESLFTLLRGFAEEKRWHLKYAKYNAFRPQSLRSHSISIASLSESLLDYLIESGKIKDDDELRVKTILVGFLHDSGKASEEWQKGAVDFITSGKRIDEETYPHQLRERVRPWVEELRQFLGFNVKDVWDEVLWCITEIGEKENLKGMIEGFGRRAPSPHSLLITEVVHLADTIMSKRSVEDASRLKPTGKYLQDLKFNFTKVSTVRGILTQVLHKSLEKQLSQHGWRSILWYPEGTLYIGNNNSKSGLDASELAKSVRESIGDVIKSSQSKIAKTILGKINETPVKAPELLFFDSSMIEVFWRYVFSRNKFKHTGVAVTDEDVNLFGNKLDRRGEELRVAYVRRFIAYYNAMIILNGIKTELISESAGKVTESDLNTTLSATFSKQLDILQLSIEKWPTMSNTLGRQKRRVIADDFFSSKYYSDITEWEERFKKAMIDCTIQMKDLWDRYARDKVSEVSDRLLSDISNPILPESIEQDFSRFTEVMKGGKKKGTQFCQQCGGSAEVEAIADLFGKSQTYHDHLIAGTRIDTNNKIRVCSLCDFEYKMRDLLGNKEGEIFIILPQLSLSRYDHELLQKDIEEIAFSTTDSPKITDVEEWSKKVIDGKVAAINPSRNFKAALQRVMDDAGFGDDFSNLLQNEEQIDTFQELTELLEEGQIRLKDEFQKSLEEYVSGAIPVYANPNFLILFTSSFNDKDSLRLVKRLFISCLLARRLSAVVLDEWTDVPSEHPGYTSIPKAITLSKLYDQLPQRRGWVQIHSLDKVLLRVASLFILAQYMKNKKCDFGNNTLLRLIEMDAGHVVARCNAKIGRIPTEILKYLDIVKPLQVK